MATGRVVLRPVDSLSTDDNYHGPFLVLKTHPTTDVTERTRNQGPITSRWTESSPAPSFCFAATVNTFAALYSPKEAVFNDDDIKRNTSSAMSVRKIC
mmetsp:Transcript_29298/g.70642  ORF Transcript_29298/g.70642 Transcript_29298/m.70642 type:complete len:98 (+) Transcript_29298:731-1024(+)